MIEGNSNNMLNDLNILLADLESSPAVEVKTSELNLSLDNVTLLDEQENKSETNLRTPGAILDDYSILDLDSKKIDLEIDVFKAKHQDIFDEFQKFLDRKSEIIEKQSTLKEELLESLENAGLPNVENKQFRATYVAATVRHTFDSKKFKLKYPVLYDTFTTKSDVKAYIKMTELKK